MKGLKSQRQAAGRFYLPELPYPADGLSPYIDARTIQTHHFELHQKYVDNLNEALAGRPEYKGWTLSELLLNAAALPQELQTPVLNNAGGVLNHNFYFDMMRPPQEGFGEKAVGPSGRLGLAIQAQYGGFENFRAAFGEQALAVFGSGWTWLAADEDGTLQILNMENQVTPYAEHKIPIIPIDLWEHAYFLQYEAQRRDYIDAWFSLADWKKAEILYASSCLPR